MSEPTDPREIRHNAGIVTHQIGSDARLMQPSPLTREDITEQLRNMNPQAVRGYHMREMLPRTPYDRDLVRKQRAADACGWHQKCTQEEKRLSDRCLAIINSLEHMESDKDIALIALEKLCGVDK